MSRVNQVVCDHCGKVQKDTWDNAMPEWRDPDRWDGWWSVDTTGMDSREHYDLCCLSCLKEWVKGKADYWERIEKDAAAYDILNSVSDSLESDKTFKVLIGDDSDVAVHECRFCPQCGQIRDVQMNQCDCGGNDGN